MFVDIAIPVLAFIVPIFSRMVQRNLLWKAMWKNINNPDLVAVVVSTSTSEDTGRYVRHATGAGQVQAFGHIAKSFYRAFPKSTLSHVFMSKDCGAANLDRPIILLGGPHTNEHTNRILEKYAEQLDLKIGENNAIQLDGDVYSPVVVDGKVQADVGVIISCPNPYHSTERAIAFLGSHTFGTECAARYFLEHDHLFNRLHSEYYAAVVGAEVNRDRINQPKKLKYKKLIFR